LKSKIRKIYNGFVKKQQKTLKPSAYSFKDIIRTFAKLIQRKIVQWVRS